MSLGIIWSPGWGFDKRFFEPLLSHFLGAEIISLKEYSDSRSKFTHVIGIGHSQGFHRLLKLSLVGYVSLAGFTRFCSLSSGQAGTPLKIVDRMIKAYQEHPQSVLEEFYKRCDFPEAPSKTVNGGHLLEDLQSLKTLDETTLLQSIDSPILNLVARDDRLVDQRLTQDFCDQQRQGELIFRDTGGHSLAFTEADWCAQQIKVWMKKNME